MSVASPDFASPGSLNWALAHTLRFRENDIFPHSFEYEAYKSQWTEVLDHLQKIDLSAHEVGCSLKLLAPKGKRGYQVATQLDPFDHLLYTAIVHEAAGGRCAEETSAGENSFRGAQGIV
jgi:hypothetical protein